MKIGIWLRRKWYLAIFRFRKPKLEITEALLSGNGSFIDVRYRLTRPDKANGTIPIFMVDEESGEVLRLMVLPKLGAIKTKHENHQKSGVLLFRNQNRIIRSNSKVTVVFGKLIAKHIEIN